MHIKVQGLTFNRNAPAPVWQIPPSWLGKLLPPITCKGTEGEREHQAPSLVFRGGDPIGDIANANQAKLWLLRTGRSGGR